MKRFFRILQSSFTDRLAYGSALIAALSWFLHARYPALLPGPVQTELHIYLTVVASLAAGMMTAKYVFREGYLLSMQNLLVEKEQLAATVQRMEGAMMEIREDRERLQAREALLKNKLKNFEKSETEAQLSALRKQIRLDEEDRKTCLAFLVHELRNRLQELDKDDDPEIAHMAAVLEKETQLVEREIKKGTVSLYELILKIQEIRDYLHDLAMIRLQSGGGPEESVHDHRQRHHYAWFDDSTDPSRLDRIYKFLKVAFHPDRFSSEGLKAEAKIHFQEAVQAYSTIKERLRTTH